MRFADKLLEITRKRDSLLCIGLDTDPGKIPDKLRREEDPVFSFNKEIIDSTGDFAAAYKINTAFYEAMGERGWTSLEKTISYIPDTILKIADVKRGDIGNTAKKYAEAFLSNIECDAVTVSPYLGFDSVKPFLEYSNKGVFILCLTSNESSKDFQKLSVEGKPLYHIVAEKVMEWNTGGNCGLVVGATHPDELESVRNIAPDIPFLIPGIGAQGGDLEKTIYSGTNENGEMVLINSSRGIIYNSRGDDFAEAARKAAEELRNEINRLRKTKKD